MVADITQIKSTSQFNASVYGSYVDDKYEAHLLVEQIV